MSKPRGFNYRHALETVRPDVAKVTLWGDTPERIVWPPSGIDDELDELLNDPEDVEILMGTGEPPDDR